MRTAKAAAGVFSTKSRTWALHGPAVVVLLVWMIGPTCLTVWFSIHHYSLLDMGGMPFVGIQNFIYLLTDADFAVAIYNTVLLVVGSLVVTVFLGIGVALALNRPFWGSGAARLLSVAPFFVMPPVSALIWKNLLMNPVYGLFAWIFHMLGLTPIDWMTVFPLGSITTIVVWEWTPFATLIFLTTLQSLDREQLEAAALDGARGLRLIAFIIMPHLRRSISIVVMIETIFFLSTFTEVLVTTSGGPGEASTTLPYLIYKSALLNFDISRASTEGVIAITLANIIAIFLLRTVARSVVV